MKVWTAVASVDRPGQAWQLREDGEDRGDLILDHPYAAMFVGWFVECVNGRMAEFLDPKEFPFKSKGWTSQEEYEAERDAIRAVAGDEPPEVRARIATAWHARLHPEPMTREQLDEWRETVEDIMWTFRAQSAAETPDPDPSDEVAA